MLKYNKIENEIVFHKEFAMLNNTKLPKSRSPQVLTISALKLRFDKKELIIPSVQRDLVWTKSQKQLLIDSLIKDFDIPKLYFRPVLKNGIQAYEVIDGQQRINAIIDFLNDEFELAADADPFNGEILAKKKYSELSSDFQIEFNSRSLDIIHLVNYSDEDMEETFLRLQNGTPLKAAEKRRAIPGEMRNIIRDLAQNPVFANYCGFGDLHYAYEDICAKILIQIIAGRPTSISAQSLRKMYEQNPNILQSDKAVKNAKKALNFINKAFGKVDSNPHLKKYAITDLAVLASSLLDTYDLNQYPAEFAQAFLDFQTLRVLNNEKDEEDQDPVLMEYNNCARGDGLGYLEFRQNTFREYLLEKMPYLTTKDPQRLFTKDQKAVIFRLGKGICAGCGKKLSEDDFEADHIVPHSKGGKTQIANGQILCSDCNKSKGAS